MSRVEEGAIPIPDARHKEFTLVLVRDYPNEKVLLGEKLRGFGTGCVDDSRVQDGRTNERTNERTRACMWE